MPYWYCLSQRTHGYLRWAQVKKADWRIWGTGWKIRSGVWLGLLGTRKLSETEGVNFIFKCLSNFWFSLCSFSFHDVLQHSTALTYFSFMSIFELLLETCWLWWPSWPMMVESFVRSVATKAYLFSRRNRFIENEPVGKKRCQKSFCYSCFYKRKKGLEISVCFFKAW